jgi:ElaB/YqjD/DUF883 family membrane-anchored ribosome-binding protein
MALNMEAIQGQWTEIQGMIQKRWEQLTDDDLGVLKHNLNELVGFIEQKTGEGRESIESFLNALSSRGAAAFSDAAEVAGRYAHDARERLDRAERVVRRLPGQSVAVAFGVGLAAGLIVGVALRRR